MASLRSFLLASALPAALVACGGEDGPAPPSGPHHGYVVDSVTVPDDKIFDLDDDGVKDNQLGQVINILTSQGFDVQTTLDEAVSQGTIILLLDMQTPDFASAAGAGLSLKLGANPTPAPCTDPDNPTPATCGMHLAGGASFEIDADSPPDANVDGLIAGGVFTGGPGTVKLQIALADSDPIDLELIGTRAKATSLSADALGEVVIAGALTEEDLNGMVIPAIHAQLGPILAEDCQPTGAPTCGCQPDSTGETIISFFDDMPADCAVTVDEIKNNGFIQSVLSPDVTINGVDALSLTVQVSGVNATFPGIDAQ